MSINTTPVRAMKTSPTIETCDALMIALDSQRLVIVRRDDKIRIWSAEQLCRPVRQLPPGDRVYYNGGLDKVRALAVY